MLSRVFTRRFAGNYLSTLAIIGLAYWIIRDLSAFHSGMLQARWQLGNLDLDFAITIHQLLVGLIVLYAVVLVPYYACYPWLHSKAFVFLQGLWFAIRRWRRPMAVGLSSGTRQAGLTLLLKFFFAPLMINWCLAHASDMTHSVVHLIDGIGAGIRGRDLFDSWVFWAAFQLILFIDTFLFTIGYIVEIPAFGNRIRSVDPTFFGWAICLCCYPPFNDLTSRFLAWQSSDFPHFENDAVHYIANIAVLTALGIYSWASVALGLKASNLTNRGIVARGPYRYVRHPAYAAKNAAWWIGTLPTLHAALAIQNWRGVSYALLVMAAWSAIYALRGITEERHLLLANNGYAEYMRRVKWRFIPGVI